MTFPSLVADLAFAQAITALSRGGRANASRLIVLRSASDYTYEPDGDDIGRWFFHDDSHMLASEAFDALVTAGMPILSMIVASVDVDSAKGEDAARIDHVNGSLSLRAILVGALLAVLLALALASRALCWRRAPCAADGGDAPAAKLRRHTELRDEHVEEQSEQENQTAAGASATMSTTT